MRYMPSKPDESFVNTQYYYYVYKIHLGLFILLNILISDRVPLLCNIFLTRPVSDFSPFARDLNRPTIQYF